MRQWFQPILETKSGYQIIQLLNGRSNVFLLSCNEKHILIDTGRKNKWLKLSNRLDFLGINHIEALILTHTHFDHAENAVKIKEKYHAKVVVHRSEAGYLASGNSPLPAGLLFPTRLFIQCFAKKIQPYLKYKGCFSDILIDDAFNLDSLGFNAYILHTPGHSSGTISVIIDNEVAIVGDAMFGVLPGSVLPPYADNKNMLIASWKKLLSTGCQLFLPGHGTANSRILLKRCYGKRADPDIK